MKIDFNDQTDSVSTDQIDLLKRLLLFAAEKEDVSSRAELSISFVDNKEIQELNRLYRNKNEPTDVISFAFQDTEEVIVADESTPFILGDIVISIEKAEEQAVSYNHSFTREMSFLIIHGLLHLLGYDHEDQASETKMFEKQTELLSGFGIER